MKLVWSLEDEVSLLMALFFSFDGGMLLLLKMSRGDTKVFVWVEEDGGLCVCWLLMKFEVCYGVMS